MAELTQEQRFKFRRRWELEHAQKEEPQPEPAPAPQPERLSPYERSLRQSEESTLGKVGAAGMSLATMVPAGFMALGAGAAGAALPGESGQGQRYMDEVAQGLTFRPRSEGAQTMVDAATWGPRKVAGWIHEGSQWLTDKMLLSELTSPAAPYVGALGEGTGNTLISLLSGRVAGAIPRIGLKGPPRPGPLEGFSPSELSALDAKYARPAVPDVPEATLVPGTALDKRYGGPPEPEAAAPEAAPEAQQPASIPLDQLTQERINRAAGLTVQRQPIKPGGVVAEAPTALTKGQATRDPELLRQEELLSGTKEGKAIRDLHVEQNRAIIENLEDLKSRAGPKSVKLEDIGRRVAGEKPAGERTGIEGALAMKERKSADRVNKLYDQVRASPENNMPVDPKPVIDWLTENNASAASAKSIESMENQLKKWGAMKLDAAGNPVAVRQLTIGEMEELRKKTNVLGKNGGADGHFMGELRSVIDRTTEGAGGDFYKGARAARKAHAMEFEEPRAIAQLLDSRSRTDRKVALEDVWHKTVIGGSIADLQRVRETLLSSTDRRVRDAGRKAWRDLSANSVDYIKEEATKGIAPDASGNKVVSPSQMKNAMNRIGRPQLELLLGKSGLAELDNVLKFAQDVKTMPPNKAGSTTTPNLMAMAALEGVKKHIFNVPGMHQLAKGMVESHTATAATEQALNFPPRPARSITELNADIKSSERLRQNQNKVRLSDLPKAVGKTYLGVSPMLGLRRPEDRE
jgi:hypothetical protein